MEPATWLWSTSPSKERRFFRRSFRDAYTKVCILDLDVNGVASLKSSNALDPIYVFISPPGDDPVSVLEDRLRKRLVSPASIALTCRGTETEESLRGRLDDARRELRFRDVPDFFDHIVINDDLETAYKEFAKIALQQDEL